MKQKFYAYEQATKSGNFSESMILETYASLRLRQMWCKIKTIISISSSWLKIMKTIYLMFKNDKQWFKKWLVAEWRQGISWTNDDIAIQGKYTALGFNVLVLSLEYETGNGHWPGGMHVVPVYWKQPVQSCSSEH